jgi:hypothetical protein
MRNVGGITSGGVQSSGSQFGSAWVASLPSSAARRIAVYGRQKRKWYLASKQANPPSIIAKFTNASTRAASHGVLRASSGHWYSWDQVRRRRDAGLRESTPTRISVTTI